MGYYTFNYGDGLSNLVSRFYDGKLYKKNSVLLPNGTTLNNGNVWANYNIQGLPGNAPSRVVPMVLDHPKGSFRIVTSGVNTVPLTSNLPVGKFCVVDWHGASYTTSIYLTLFKLSFGGALKTLQEAVNEGLIEPMVLMNSYEPAGSSYVWTNFMNMYTGGQTSQNSYPRGCIAFVPKVDTISGFVFTTNKAWTLSYADGVVLSYCDPEDGVALNMTYVEKAQTGIIVKQHPTKNIYFLGESLNISGLVVAATYSDLSEETLGVTLADISGFDSSQTVSGQILTITIGEFSTTTSITVVVKTPTSLRFSSYPFKTVYTVGDTFSFLGLTVERVFQDDSSEVVDELELSLSGFDTAQPAPFQMLGLSVDGFTLTFEISVLSAPLNWGKKCKIVFDRELHNISSDICESFRLVETMYGTFIYPEEVTIGSSVNELILHFENFNEAVTPLELQYIGGTNFGGVDFPLEPFVITPTIRHLNPTTSRDNILINDITLSGEFFIPFDGKVFGEDSNIKATSLEFTASYFETTFSSGLVDDGYISAATINLTGQHCDINGVPL